DDGGWWVVAKVGSDSRCTASGKAPEAWLPPRILEHRPRIALQHRYVPLEWDAEASALLYGVREQGEIDLEIDLGPCGKRPKPRNLVLNRVGRHDRDACSAHGERGIVF